MALDRLALGAGSRELGTRSFGCCRGVVLRPTRGLRALDERKLLVSTPLDERLRPQ
jgi:hypothetical protein